MSVTTAGQLREHLEEYDSDEVIVYTLYSYKDIDIALLPEWDGPEDVWASIHGAVDKSIGYAEQEINDSLNQLVEEYYKDER